MDITALTNVVITLFLLLSVGFAGRKLKISALDAAGVKRLSQLILIVAQPALIVNSLVKNAYSAEGLREGLAIVALGFALHIFFAVLAFFLVKPLRKLDERKLSELLLILSNCGFIGFPILQAVLGDRGVFWGAFYFIPYHTCTWTWGMAILGRGRGDIKMTPKRILINPGTIPCLVGFLLFVSRIQLPAFLFNATSYIGALCTPISLLITGAILADLPLRELLLNPKNYYISACKLILIPLLVCTIAKLIRLPYDMAIFATVMSALPPAAVVSMLAATYDIDPEYAARAVGLGPILMVITLPLVMTAANIIIN